MKTIILISAATNFLAVTLFSQNPASEYLDTNRVRAMYFNNNSIFFDQTDQAAYEVPKGSGKHSLFAHSMWIAGKDSTGLLHAGAFRYGASGRDFYPGPLYNQGPLAGTCDSALSSQYNNIWKINTYEIQEFRYRFVNNLMSGYTIPGSILYWPAHGIANCDYYLAPFYDYNSDSSYNPYDGDYPLIKGDQTLFWVFNDNTAPHTETQSLALGVEVRCMAYSFACDSLNLATFGASDYTTFLSYQIINRSANTYEDSYIGLFTDGDIGYYLDDYIGFNLEKNAYYFYNDSSFDGTGTGNSYGLYPPAIATVLLGGVYIDADGADNPSSYDTITGNFVCDSNVFNGNINGTNFGDGVTDNEKYGFTNLMYFNNGSCVICDPAVGPEYYYCMTSFWRNGTPLTWGGNGYATGGDTARFVYPENSDQCFYGTNGVVQAEWSEVTAGNVSDDRRGIGSMGPLTIEPGEIINIDIAFVWSRDTTGGDVLTKLFNDIDLIRNLYNNGNLPSCQYDIGLKVNNNNLLPGSIKVYPSPVCSELNIEINPLKTCNYSYGIFNTQGVEIISGKLTEQHSRIQIDILNQGIYFIKVYGNENVWVNRFVKIKQ